MNTVKYDINGQEINFENYKNMLYKNAHKLSSITGLPYDEILSELYEQFVLSIFDYNEKYAFTTFFYKTVVNGRMKRICFNLLKHENFSPTVDFSTWYNGNSMAIRTSIEHPIIDDSYKNTFNFIDKLIKLSDKAQKAVHFLLEEFDFNDLNHISRKNVKITVVIKNHFNISYKEALEIFKEIKTMLQNI